MVTFLEELPTEVNGSVQILNWPSSYPIYNKDFFEDYNKKIYHVYIYGDSGNSLPSKTIRFIDDFPDYCENPDKYEFYFEVKNYIQMIGNLDRVFFVCKSILGNIDANYGAPFKENSILLDCFPPGSSLNKKIMSTGTLAYLSKNKTYSEILKAKMYWPSLQTKYFALLNFQPVYPDASTTATEANGYYYDIIIYWKKNI